MKYQEAIQYLYNLVNYESMPLSYSDLKLERMQELVKRIGNPHKKFPIILVAGTKGKGSTSYFLMRLLSASGLRCGLHSKPHLFTFRERIRIGEKLIPPQDVAILTDYLAPIVEDMGKNSPFGKPTYFEISVAMAFLYFSLHEIDIAVIEVGLGGRLDATNVCDPQLTIITPISFDHMEFLGNTLSEIAREKTGILRPNVKCILAPQEKEAKDTILIEARTKGSQIYMLEEFCQYEILERAPWGSRFRLKISGWGESEVSLRFLGDHQVTNFLVALLASKEWGLPWSEAILTKALRDVYWPGRIEILSHEPLVIFDVAHNQASFSQLRETLRKFLRVEKAIFLLGFLRGKEYWKISQEVVPHSRKILITQPLNPRAADPWEVAPFFQSKDVPVEIVEDPFEAKELAFLYSRESGYPLVIAGSFYLARPFIREFSQSYEEEEVRLC